MRIELSEHTLKGLVPGSSLAASVLQIAGVIDAEPREIFATVATGPDDLHVDEDLITRLPGDFLDISGVLRNGLPPLKQAPKPVVTPPVMPAVTPSGILPTGGSVVPAPPVITDLTAQVARPVIRRLGRVALVGTGNPRVFPEWWGASRRGLHTEPAVDTAAIRAAIRAAILDREALTAQAPRPSLTIYFGGSYTIQGEIVVSAPDGGGLVREVLFEGASGPGLVPTLGRPRCCASSG